MGHRMWSEKFNMTRNRVRRHERRLMGGVSVSTRFMERETMLCCANIAEPGLCISSMTRFTIPSGMVFKLPLLSVCVVAENASLMR